MSADYSGYGGFTTDHVTECHHTATSAEENEFCSQYAADCSTWPTAYFPAGDQPNEDTNPEPEEPIPGSIPEDWLSESALELSNLGLRGADSLQGSEYIFFESEPLYDMVSTPSVLLPSLDPNAGSCAYVASNVTANCTSCLGPLPMLYRKGNLSRHLRRHIIYYCRRCDLALRFGGASCGRPIALPDSVPSKPGLELYSLAFNMKAQYSEMI